MTDESAMLTAMTWGSYGAEQWQDAPGVNIIDGGAPFYNTYSTADGKWIAVGAIEPAFYAQLLDRLGLAADPLFARQHDRPAWPAMKDRWPR